MRSFSEVIKFALSAGISAFVGGRVLYCLWELTYRCTAKCAICSYWRNPSDPAKELKFADIQEGLKRIHAYGCRAVNFTGGEPTIRSDLERIVNCASNSGMWTSVVSNGTLLTRERIGRLKNAGLDNILISLDSIDPHVHDSQRNVKGSHAKVVDCLRWLSDEFLTGHRTGGIMCVLSNMNTHQVDKLVEFADQFGVYVVFQPYHESKTGNVNFKMDSNEGAIASLVTLKARYKNVLCSDSYLRGFSGFCSNEPRPVCYAGQKYFSVDPFGFLHPCVDMPRIGHVLTDDISVVRSPEALKSVKACRGCWYSFRGEADGTLSFRGYMEKLRLASSVVLHNRRQRRSRMQIA